MKETALSRRARERENQRQEILAAALRLFSAKGYHSVTMHEIAEASEFAVGTLYKFFRNKEDLYRELMLESTAAFFGEIRRAIEGQDDEVAQLKSLTKAKFEVFRSNVLLIRLFFTEMHGESFNRRAGLDAEIRRNHEELINFVAAIFASGIQRGRFRPIAAPADLALAFDGVTNAFFFSWFYEPELHPFPEDSDAILDIFFKGLLDQ